MSTPNEKQDAPMRCDVCGKSTNLSYNHELTCCLMPGCTGRYAIPVPAHFAFSSDPVKQADHHFQAAREHPNENQAGEKQAHSKESWIATKAFVSKNGLWMVTVTFRGVGQCQALGYTKEEAEANAARIVALFNGCKEVPNIWFAVSSSSTPVKDLIDENGLLGEENQNLRKENERLKACAQIGEEWRENSSLEKWFPFTAEELKSLRKQLAEAKTQTKIAADLGDKCEQLEKILEDSRAELAKEKQRILFDQDAVDKLSRCGAEVEALIAELATLRQERRLWLRATNP